MGLMSFLRTPPAALAAAVAMCCTASVFAQPAIPGNDLCSGATPLTLNTPAYGSTVNATPFLDGPAAPCQASSHFRGVWFTFTPPATGRYQINASGTRADTVATVFQQVDCTGFNDALFVVAPGGCNDDSGSGIPGPGATGSTTAPLISNLLLTGSQQYWIRLSALSSPAQYEVAVYDYGNAVGACCSNAGACTLTMPNLCGTVDSTFLFLGSGSVCSPNPCVGACCLTASPFTCTVTFPGTGTGGCLTGNLWQGFGTTCPAGNVCTLGACCSTAAACTITNFAACGTTSSWQAGVSTCTATTCFPMGACCLSTSPFTCVVFSSGTACASGTFQGFGTTCPSGNICVTGSCCTTTNTCTVTIPTSCTGTSHWLAGGTCAAGSCQQACCNTTTFACTIANTSGTGCATGTTTLGIGSACTAGVCDSGACCSTAGVCTLTSSRLCVTSNSFAGVGTVCTPNVCTGACCNNSTLACSIQVIGTAGCINQGLFTTCSPTDPCAALGACCSTTFACTFGVAGNCTGTSIFTAGVACLPAYNPCGAGACCNGGTCTTATAAGCVSSGGVFQGTSSACPGSYSILSVGTTAVEDISASPTATQLALGDDASSAAITLPFTFRHFGVVRPSLLINSNGWLGFDTAGTQPTAAQMRAPVVPLGGNAASNLPPNDFIAAYWRDLNQNAAVTPAQTISYETRGVAPFRRFIALWKVAIFSNTGYHTFEIILYEGSDVVELRYGAFTTATTDATFGAGLESSTGLAGLNIPASSIAQNTSYLIAPGNSCTSSYASGACCAGASCTFGTQAACQGVGGSYQGDGSSCSPTNPCVTSACCLPNGTCSVQISTICASNGGTYTLPDGTACPAGGGPACADSGRCCTGVTCSLTFASACTGTYLSGNYVCSPNPCSGSCCTAVGGCTVTVDAPSCAGNFTLSGVCSPNTCPLVNDVCTGAFVLTPGVTTAASNAAATSTGDGAVQTCQSSVKNGVWFSLTTPSSGAGDWQVTTCVGAAHDTVLTVFNAGIDCTGIGTASNILACNDDAGPWCTGTQASVTVNLAASTTYLIRVETWGSGTSGPFSILAAQLIATGICCNNTTGACSSIFSGTCGTGTTAGTGTVCGAGTPSSSCAPIGICCNNTTGACSVIYGGTCATTATAGTGTTCSAGTPSSSCPVTTTCCNATSCACTTIFGGSCPSGTTTGTGTVCSASTCPAGAICCNNTTGACTTVCVAGTCATGTTQGTGTTCGAGACPSVLACCNTTSGACSVIYGGTCPSGTADSSPASATCGAGVCPPSGACCSATNVCTVVLDNAGSPVCTGTYKGVNSVCSPNPCLLSDECDTTTLVAVVGANPADSTGATTSTVITSVASCPSGLSGSGGSNDVFFRFVAPATAAYKLDDCGTAGYDSVLSVHGGCPATDSNLIACNDDFITGSTCVDGSTPASLRSVINSVVLTAGQTYYIRVAGYGTTGGATGPFTLNIGVGALGACCVASSCTSTDAANCSGTWNSGIACSSNPCAPPGVCCRGSTCNTTYTTAAACAAALDTVAPATVLSKFVTGSAVCNTPVTVPGTLGNTTSPCCYANYNHNATLEIQDIFDYLNDWFAGKKAALVGGDGSSGTLAIQNIFDFLNAWFAGGCS